MKQAVYIKTFLVVSTLISILDASRLHAEELVLDTVIAAVDSEAVTLRELQDLLGSSDKPQSLKGNPAYSQALQALISKKVLESEAAEANINVSEEEIEFQLQQLAAQNNLSMEAFEAALTQQNQTLSALKEDLRVQILRSKVVRSQLRDSIVISDEEARRFLGIKSDQDYVNISYILIPFTPETEQSARDLASKIHGALKSGVPFKDVLEAFGTPEVTFDQNKLIAQDELNQTIQSALETLDIGSFSKPLRLATAFQIVQLHANLKAGAEIDEKILEQAKARLQSQKMQQKALTFLAEDLPKKHHIEIFK